MDFSTTSFEKPGVTVENDDIQDYYGLLRLTGKMRQLFEDHIPREVGNGATPQRTAANWQFHVARRTDRLSL